MMDLMLSGRSDPPTSSEDYEAQSALRTLLESEKIQECCDDELYERICEQIEYNQDLLSRVYDLVEGLRNSETVGKEAGDALSRVDRALNSRKERY